MITLLNGRGLLGEALEKYKKNYDSDDLNWMIYHTWNVIELENEEIQNNEYKKFVNFVNQNKNENILYISTNYIKDTVYLQNKIRAEVYLIDNVKNWKIIRMPHFIGKGTFQKFKEGELPWNYDEEMDLIGMKEACQCIYECLRNNKKFNYVKGEFVTKRNIYNLIRYGVE